MIDGGQTQIPLHPESTEHQPGNGTVDGYHALTPNPLYVVRTGEESDSGSESLIEEAEYEDTANRGPGGCGLTVLAAWGARSLHCTDTCSGRLRGNGKLPVQQIPHDASPALTADGALQMDAMGSATSERDERGESKVVRTRSKKGTLSHHDSVRANDRLNFITSSRFQGIIAAIIGLNALVLAAEVDYPHPVLIPDLWIYFDTFFQVAFTIELLLREQHRGWRAFLMGQDRWWNMFDTIIVVIGIIELWVVPLLRTEFDFLRILRLLRLLRLIRAVRMIRRLSIFMEAIVHMLNPLFWVMTTFFMGLGLVAVIMTHLVGRGEGIPEEHQSGHSFAEIQPRFNTVTTSFYTLFQIVTVDNWTPIAFPLIAISPSWRWFFIIFIAFASWTMISILTAVASENVIGAASGRAEKEREQAEHQRKEFIAFLSRFFHEADQDGNGLLDFEEFTSIVEADRLQQKLDEMAIHVDKQELYRTWEMLDVSGEGQLKFDEFIDGLSCLQDGLSTKYVVNLDYSIRRVAVLIEGRLEKLESQVEGWRHRNDLLLQSLRRQHKLQQEQSVALWAWRQWASRSYPGTIRPQALSAISGSKETDGSVVQALPQEKPPVSQSQPVESIPNLSAAVHHASSGSHASKVAAKASHRRRRRGSVGSLMGYGMGERRGNHHPQIDLVHAQSEPLGRLTP
mmetsp:Transcript_34377/g.78335  ORF Transcript_34377/g.78335 Transcript_34377/m.78335 type:complete len:682 (+) Transcript_34377:51-2096(+)